MKPLIIIGFGEHGRVVREIAEEFGEYKVIGFIDYCQEARDGIACLGADEDIEMIMNSYPEASYVIGIGELRIRRKIIDRYIPYDLNFTTIISSQALIAPSAIIESGSTILRGAIINTNAFVGRHCIVNSGAIIEHDCILRENVHVAPGACLGGSVSIGHDSAVFLGARIILGLKVGHHAIVGAGAVVLHNVDDGIFVAGIPAKVVRHNSK